MLNIRDLSKTYANGVKALREVSLDIPQGMFGLLGPNGAGKSSLMRTIATLQDPDEGSVTLNGQNLLADKQATRRLLGYLPQEFGVYPKVAADAMLDHFAVLKGVTNKHERRELVESLLRQVNLWDVRKRKLGTFSGGMRQRFGIAQALIGDPRLVIVDEPTAGLDPEERNRFLNLLAEIGERVWRRSIDKSELDGYRARMNILSTRLTGGRTQIHVLADSSPGEGFETVSPDLEDVYFGELRKQAVAKAA